MEDDEPGQPASSKGDLKADNQKLSVQFKAQHGLLVLFFILLLYELGNHLLYGNAPGLTFAQNLPWNRHRPLPERLPALSARPPRPLRMRRPTH